MARARSTPPASGETMTRSGNLELADRLEQHRRGEQVVDRDVEEALDLRRVQVHASARGRRRRAEIRSATSLAVIGTRGWSFLSWRA